MDVVYAILFENRYKSVCAKYGVSISKAQLMVLAVGYVIESRCGCFTLHDLRVSYGKLGLRVSGQLLCKLVRDGKVDMVGRYSYRVCAVWVSFLRDLGA